LSRRPDRPTAVHSSRSSAARPGGLAPSRARGWPQLDASAKLDWDCLSLLAEAWRCLISILKVAHVSGAGPRRAVPCRAVPCRAVPCRAVPCRQTRRIRSHVVVWCYHVRGKPLSDAPWDLGARLGLLPPVYVPRRALAGKIFLRKSLLNRAKTSSKNGQAEDRAQFRVWASRTHHRPTHS